MSLQHYSFSAELLDSQQAYEAMAHAINPYGDGHAADRILAALRGDFGAAEWGTRNSQGVDF